MIKLNESHREELINFLNEDSATNLFLLGDLEQYGFDDAVQSYYGLYLDNILVAAILRYRDISMLVYAKVNDLRVIEKIKSLKIEYPEIKNINIGEATYHLFKEQLDALVSNVKRTQMSVFNPRRVVEITHPVEILKVEDVEDILAVFATCFPHHPKSSGLLQENINNGSEVVYGVRDGGKLVSVGSYTAETDANAMIIGVGTLPEYRTKGYATSLVGTLSMDLFEKGKKGVLFYDNPAAASIYEGMGYEPYSIYYMLEF